METQQPGIKEQKLKTMEELRTQLDVFSVGYNEVVGLLFSINQLADQIHVADFSTSSKPSASHGTSRMKGHETLDERRLVVTFSADFAKFATFVNQLERNRPVIFIDKFTITNKSSTTSKHPVSMVITFLARKKQDEKNAFGSIKQNNLVALNTGF